MQTKRSRQKLLTNLSFWIPAGIMLGFVAAPFVFFGYLYFGLFGPQGHQYERPELQTILHQKQTQFERAVSICGAGVVLRSVSTEQGSIDGFGFASEAQIADRGGELLRLAKTLKATRIECGWLFRDDGPSFEFVLFRLYFDEDRQGVHAQSLVFYLPDFDEDPQSRIHPSNDITLTKLPVQGWYIWEEGIDHKSTER